jgi:hypothetical protein
MNSGEKAGFSTEGLYMLEIMMGSSHSRNTAAHSHHPTCSPHSEDMLQDVTRSILMRGRPDRAHSPLREEHAPTHNYGTELIYI